MESARRARTGVIAVLTALAMSIGGLVLVPVAAVAAPASGATLDWGVKSDFRTYVTGPIASGSITALDGASPSGNAVYRWGAGNGEADGAAGTADLDFGGAIQFVGHAGELDMTISDPRLVLTSATTGVLYATVFVEQAYGGFPATDATIPFANLTFSELTVTAAAISGTSATSTLTPEAKAAFGGVYNDPSREAADPVSFSIPIEQVAESTTTGLTVDPSTGSADAGTAITLTATVVPSSAAGTVQFFSSTGVALGAAQTVAGGTASLTVDDLAAGSYAFSAGFTPDDADAFEGSSSGESAFTVTTPATAVATTTTTPTTSPAAPVTLGTSTTVSTTVTAGDSSIPVGTVEFFRIPAGAGTTPVSLGTSAVSGTGTASVPVVLPAGGQTFSATFTPADLADFVGSSSAATAANYGVVDTALPAVCTPGAGAAVSAETASASWVFPWNGPITRTGTNGVSVSGSTFSLTGGVVTSSATCTEIAFDGTIGLNLYGMFQVNLDDPTLVIDSSGNGAWRATVTTPTTTTPTLLTLSTFTGAAVVAGGDNDLSIEFDWAGTTAPGTWSAGAAPSAGGAVVAFAEAWANEFVLALPSSLRGHFHASTSASSASVNLAKKPSNLDVEFTWPAITTLGLTASPAGTQVAGSPVTLTATVTPSTATGSVEFFETPFGGVERSLGSAAVSGGIATIAPTDLVGGGHAVRAAFTSETFEGSTATLAAAYRVVDTATAPLCTVPVGAEQLPGVSLDWNVSAYSSDWLKFLDGVPLAAGSQTFQLRDGVASIGDDCTSIAFEGTLRLEAYNSFFPTHGQWVELVDPELVLDADGDGAWIAGVRAGASALSSVAPVRTVITEITGATVPDFDGSATSATIALDYAGTTAPGTWSGSATDARTAAWSNAFVLQVPSMIRSFYYQSGAGGDSRKAPAPLELTWGALTVTSSIDSVVQGGTIAFTGAGFRVGDEVTATVNSEPVVIGTRTASVFGTVAFDWTVPAGFEVGRHTIVLETADGRSASLQFEVTPAAAVCVARAIDGGSLTWGVRSSFRNYILGPIANGSITFLGSSTTASSYTWGGATGSINTKDAAGRAGWSGSLVFSGHGGLLDLRISNPRIQITNASTAYVIATVYATNSSGQVVEDGQVTLAQVALPAGAISGDSVSVSGASTWLTSAGAAAFGGFYSAGDALDPISFSLALGGEVPCDDYSDPSKLAATGSTGPQLDAIWIGALLMALGGGIVVLRRRRRTA